MTQRISRGWEVSGDQMRESFVCRIKKAWVLFNQEFDATKEFETR